MTYDRTLDSNCAAHANYMVTTGTITHNEDPSNPAYSDAGQVCAGKGNLWLGMPFPGPSNSPADSVDAWMRSPAPPSVAPLSHYQDDGLRVRRPHRGVRRRGA